MLLYEDNDIRSRHFVGALPERVMTLSTGDLLRELGSAGRIQSADHILDVAAVNARNVDALRTARSDDEALAILRRQLQGDGGEIGR